MEITTQLDDVPVELIHRILSSLWWDKQVAQTCVLSKSWLHAWSTIPTLRFRFLLLQESQEKSYNDWIDRTLVRYHLDNIPIQSFHFECIIRNYEYAVLVEKWIRLVASKSSCLKELSLFIGVAEINSFTLPHEILFSSKNLDTIHIYFVNSGKTNPVSISSNLVIKCVSLRVLALDNMDMSDDLLDLILSRCSLLEKIKLFRCKGLRTVKVKNLPCLRELKLFLVEKNDVIEFDNVPSLDYGTSYHKVLPFKTDSLRNVALLHLDGVIINNAFLEIIKLKLPFLESLSLKINSCPWGLEENSLVITSSSLQKLYLCLLGEERSIHVQVYAPNLLSFSYYGDTRPTVIFPTIAPKEVSITVKGTYNAKQS